MTMDPWSDPHVMALAKAVDHLYDTEHNVHQRRARLVELIAQHENKRVFDALRIVCSVFRTEPEAGAKPL